MRSLRNEMCTGCVKQVLPVMHAFGAWKNASHHLSQRSGITYHNGCKWLLHCGMLAIGRYKKFKFLTLCNTPLRWICYCKPQSGVVIFGNGFLDSNASVRTGSE